MRSVSLDANIRLVGSYTAPKTTEVLGSAALLIRHAATSVAEQWRATMAHAFGLDFKWTAHMHMMTTVSSRTSSEEHGRS